MLAGLAFDGLVMPVLVSFLIAGWVIYPFISWAFFGTFEIIPDDAGFMKWLIVIIITSIFSILIWRRMGLFGKKSASRNRTTK